jgi:hypothetical protein
MQEPIQPQTPRIPFDKLWKGIVTDHFQDFLEMFMPKLYKKVDFSVEFKFLEQELKSVLMNKTLKQMDKLVGVKMKNGKEEWIFVHIEFENSHSPKIKERMFDYYYRIKEKYGKKITALVIYTGEKSPKDSHIYKSEVYGTIASYEFNVYEIAKQSEKELLANPNPFAIFVLANMYVSQTYENATLRLERKEQMYRLARQRNYSEDKINRILLFIFEIIKLPPDLETQFNEHISKPQNSNDMVYTTQTSRDTVDALAKQAFGQTVTEIDTALVKTIIILFTKVKMSIDEIAEDTGLQAKFIHDLLKKHKLIKK